MFLGVGKEMLSDPKSQNKSQQAQTLNETHVNKVFSLGFGLWVR